MLMYKTEKRSQGFTIVELLVVIVVIGILATIAIISYNGVAKRATDAGLKSTLRDGQKLVELFNATNGRHPDDASEDEAFERLTNDRSSKALGYYKIDDTLYCIDIYSLRYNDLMYKISSGTGRIEEGLCDGNSSVSDMAASAFIVQDGCYLYDKLEKAIIAYGWKTVNIQGDYSSFHTVHEEGDGWTLDHSCTMSPSIPATIKGVPVVSISGSKGQGFGTQNEGPGMAGSERQLDSVILPSSLKKIQHGAFGRSNLTSIALPAGLEEIGVYAFADNRIEALDIPDSVKRIEARAFEGNKISQVTIPVGVEHVGYASFSDQGGYGADKIQITCRIPYTTAVESNAGCDTVIRY